MAGAYTCAGGALLVGTDHALAVGRARRPGETVGCDQLVCQACGAEVIALPGVRLVREPRSAAEFAALREATDPDAEPLLARAEATVRFRLYLCRCSADETAGASPASAIEAGWACAGHPR
ncbi:MAG: hypothetical protein H6835_16555 [Planctomycetes bacterium]|nr:hypothetical protein [Planctomycetota bacterium]